MAPWNGPNNVCITYISGLKVRCVVLMQLIPMTDIQEVSPDFQKLNKSEHCIVLHMKNETKIAITSPVCTAVD